MKIDVFVTAAITSVIWLLVILIASIFYHSVQPDVLVVTKANKTGTYHWMPKAYLEKQQKATRYVIPTKRVLVMFE